MSGSQGGMRNGQEQHDAVENALRIDNNSDQFC
jgi:hypothetical protein